MTEHHCPKPEFWECMVNGIIGAAYEKNWPFNTKGLIFKGHSIGGPGPVFRLEYCPFCGAKLGTKNEWVEEPERHPPLK